MNSCYYVHGAQATGTCLFPAWSSSHWDMPFPCMELKPLGRAFSLHGARATGTCLFSAWSSSHWDVPFLCMRPMQGGLRSASPPQIASRGITRNLEWKEANTIPLTWSVWLTVQKCEVQSSNSGMHEFKPP